MIVMTNLKYDLRAFDFLMFSFFLFLGCFSKSKEAGTSSLKDVKLSSLMGEKIDMDEFKGKTVFINFWATWCKPCIQEMPTIDSAQMLFRNKDVVFLMASNEDAGKIHKFSNKHTYGFRYVKLENLEELNIQALPTTFIFDSDGVLQFSETGFRLWDEPENIALISNICAHGK